MTRSILAKLERIIQDRIAAKKEMSEKYNFMEIKRAVLFEFKNDLGDERDAYSSELSRRFGTEGGKKSKRKRGKKLNAKRLILGAREFWMREKIRAGMLQEEDNRPTEPLELE